MKKTILLIASLLMMKIGVAQTNEDSTKLNSNFTFRTNLFTNTIGYEQVLSNNFTLNTEVGLTAGGIGFKLNPISDSQFNTYLGFKIESRYYYNIDNRVTKLKNTKNNSFNYFGFSFNYASPINYYLGKNTDYKFHASTSNPNGNLILSPKWAIKRNISGNFGYELGVGASMVTNFKNTYFTPNITLNLNYRF